MLTLPKMLKNLEKLEEELETCVSIAFNPDESGAVWKDLDGDEGPSIHFEFEDLDELSKLLK